jgi:NAD(P)-dependent dehydrogenase (short-subunit alcohol dehydrogenase family)/rhamnose utilization protein RhaD (predicted bifunctional aldolase and dehydrogenase)
VALRELIEISRAVGDDPDLVQGGGGNTSVKTADGKTMFVKASGTALGAMDETCGWAQLDLAAARDMLDNAALRKMPSARRESEVLRLLQGLVEEPAGARPSVETSLHALLDRVVIHTHPVGLNALLSSQKSGASVAKIVGGKPLCVPYVDPGFTLAARVRDDIAKYVDEHGKLPKVVLLENHGVFVAAPDVKKCLSLSRKVTGAGEKWAELGRVNPKVFPLVREVALNGTSPVTSDKDRSTELRGALLRCDVRPGVVRRDDSDAAARFVRSKAAFDLATKGAFTPDQIVYCGTVPLVLRGKSSSVWDKGIATYRERRGIDPRVILLPGEGVYYAAESLGQLKVVSEVYRSAIVTLLRGKKAGGPRFLTRPQARFIEGWEVETFRASLLQGTAQPLSGRVAVVTGGASGLGKGISLGLIGAGATVFACDVDRAGLAEVQSEQPEGRYLPVFCDVTSEASVAETFATAAASAGGIDFLVNAAGIAPAFNLVDFPVGAWQKTLDINLTGYFLCAREAARWMLRQGAGGAMVNLTSKSGLEASKANSAYNATKAGEIHLMRGWAMELGAEGIRVNCVAPGNVFKGSKIWNDAYIKICAKKKGIKPEEVIPFYTSQSPLAKEIEPHDIANAVIYLLSDAARNVTGQTLVVDGGQVMVR